jgi:hypothetical protein
MHRTGIQAVSDAVQCGDILLRKKTLQKSFSRTKQRHENAFPDPASTLERIAGATTDIQYIIHHGFTEHPGTYWVGANALIRPKALDDIAEQDTERGWSMLNYPERLAYSATPPTSARC